MLALLLAALHPAPETLRAVEAPGPGDAPRSPSLVLPAGEADLEAALRQLIRSHGLDREALPIEGSTPASGPLFELGKQLFFSKALSENADVACASCHHPLLGGGDRLSLPVGVNAVDPAVIGPGRVHDGVRLEDPLADGGPNVPRNAPSIFNVHVFRRAMFWDGRVEVSAEESGDHATPIAIRTPDSLRRRPDVYAGADLTAAQALFPVTSPNEMFGRHPDRVLSNPQKRALLEERLRADPVEASGAPEGWLALFQDALDARGADASRVVTMKQVSAALSHYQRSQVLLDNPWFRYLAGDTTAISTAAKRGALLFYTGIEDGGSGCQACHGGRRFTDERFHNIAVPQFGRGKDRAGFDLGRMLETSNPDDRYAFRTPTLLNVEVTAPYGHTGAFLSLPDVIHHHLDAETSVRGFDFSLQGNPQFADLPVDADRNRRRSLDVLATARTQAAWARLPHAPVDPRRAAYLEAFLLTLTDPCAKDPTCLATWLPRDGDDGPDGRGLETRFAGFSGQPVTYQPPLPVPAGKRPNPAADPGFIDVTVAAGLEYGVLEAGSGSEQHRVAGGVAVDDYDGDGWPDVFVSHAVTPGRLFRNQHDGTFADRTEPVIGTLRSRQFGALFLDYDHDGRKDLLLVEDDPGDGYFRLFHNRGDGAMSPDSRKAGIRFDRFTHSLSAGDFDRDGLLDLYAGHWDSTAAPGATSGALWRNQGDGSFRDVSERLPPTRESPQTGRLGLVFTGTFTDIDADRRADLLLAGDFLTSQVLVGQPDGDFTDRTTAAISDENGMGMAVGDYDNDGDLDWFVTSIWHAGGNKAYVGGESGNRLYANDGSGVFTDVTDAAGVRAGGWGWGACFADFDNDGWLDIFHTNGMTSGAPEGEAVFGPFLDDPSRLFVNNGDGTFREAALELGLDHSGQGRGVSCFDYDRDGRLDILIANSGRAPTLYRNTLRSSGHYLTVKLQGEPGNPDGVGGRVYASTPGQTRLREIRSGSNYLSNDPPLAHFGLGPHRSAQTLRIVWPDGTEQILSSVDADQYLIVRKPGR